MTTQYQSIRVILDKILRHPLLQDISFETVVDYTVDFIRIIGMPQEFINKTEIVPIDNYRGTLPCDMYKLLQARDKHNCIPLRQAGDIFHLSEDKISPTNNNTFKIQGNFIFTSFKKGNIELSYLAIPVDCDNLPLIPDNSSFTRALELFIKKQWFTILYDTGKIPREVLHNTQQEYAWAVGDCQSEFSRLDLSEAESFFNSMKTLLVRDNEFRNSFRNNGQKEYIRLQP